jgi:flagellar biosynthesis protein FlhA
MQYPTTGQEIIAPDLARARGAPIATIVAERRPEDGAPVLVVQPRARRPMSALLKLRAPGCLVISINELPVAQPIEVIAVIGGENEQPQTLPEPVPHEFEREALAA